MFVSLNPAISCPSFSAAESSPENHVLESVNSTNRFIMVGVKSDNLVHIKMIANNIGTPEHNYFNKIENSGDTIIMLYNKCYLYAIMYENTIYELTRRISLSPIFDNGYVSVIFDELGIDVCEDTYVDVINSFCEEFDFIYKNYALCNDSELTGGAVKLKYDILSYVKEVIKL